MYYKKVNKASRKEMVDFLENHYRYNTGNSWNCSTSYANCVKYWSLDLPEDVKEKFWDFIDLDYNEFYDIECDSLIWSFRNKWGYSVGFNGRSGGYLVMYNAEKIYNENKKRYEWSVYPYKGIDMYADFNDKDEWSMNRLKERVELVQAFDKLCDDIRESLIDFLRYNNFVEEEYAEVKTRKVAKCIEE